MIRIDGHENLGGEEVAWGFVYFSDGGRVAYSSVRGVTQGITGGWHDVAITDSHVAAAEKYLTKEGVLR